jgi:hypothetical protein
MAVPSPVKGASVKSLGEIELARRGFCPLKAGACEVHCRLLSDYDGSCLVHLYLSTAIERNMTVRCNSLSSASARHMQRCLLKLLSEHPRLVKQLRGGKAPCKHEA